MLTLLIAGLLASQAPADDMTVIRAAADVCSRYVTETIDRAEVATRAHALGFADAAPKDEGDTRLTSPRQAGGSYEIIVGKDLEGPEPGRNCYIGLDRWTAADPLRFLNSPGLAVGGLERSPGSHGFFYMRAGEPVLVISAQSTDIPNMWPGLLFLEFAPYRIPDPAH